MGTAGAPGTGGTGALTKTLPTGMSAGCGVAPPANDKSSGFTVHNLTVPACGTGPITSKCVAPDFAPGGRLEQTRGGYSFVARNYAVQLPTNYNNNMAYALMIGGGGCGGGPTESGGGYNAGQGAADAIRIGLSYTGSTTATLSCFADGGTSCSGAIADEPACVNTPEVPYFYAVLAEVEAKYCIDRSKVYLGGYSSGGWETYTLGCAAADVIRGILPVNGGLRNHRPACTGPIPALMVTGANDPDNPVGPLVMGTAYAPGMLTSTQVDLDIASLDSNGSAPARDEILARNGCIGNATAAYDPAFPLCMKYTGCPAKYPVVWCSVTGAGHQGLSYMGVNYYPSLGATSLTWNFLTKLP
jgi:polyhydroxybutyrate depolymerase